MGLAATRASDEQRTVKLDDLNGWEELCSYLQ